MASDDNIDPALLALGSNTSSVSHDATLRRSTPTHLQSSDEVGQGEFTSTPTPPPSHLQPTQDERGELTMTREEYTGQLNQQRHKQPLRDACAALKLHVAASANLERLRMALISYWYPEVTSTTTTGPEVTLPSDQLADARAAPVDEAALVEHYGLDADARELLGFGDDDDEDDDDEGDEEAETFDAFQTRVRLDAVKRTKGNRREGGLKTQQASVRLWNEWVALAKAQGTIHDEIVNEHSLLLFIQYSAKRCKWTRRGVDIPNTFVGASQLKKLFFAVLRIRKEQDAADGSLARRRPATSVVVWDEIKTRMDIALKRARSGLVPGEDAPDIVTNTFLEDVSEEQMAAVGDGFIQHRERQPQDGRQREPSRGRIQR